MNEHKIKTMAIARRVLYITDVKTLASAGS